MFLDTIVYYYGSKSKKFNNFVASLHHFKLTSQVKSFDTESKFLVGYTFDLCIYILKPSPNLAPCPCSKKEPILICIGCWNQYGVSANILVADKANGYLYRPIRMPTLVALFMYYNTLQKKEV